MNVERKVGIVGAGMSGLVACKYSLSKGFHPIVFESGSCIGGVWRTNTIQTTKLQTPKPLYQFSDFPWPPSVTDDFPTHHQVVDYIESYATHFDLFNYITFNSKVETITYDGPSSAEMEAWTLWNGTADPFTSKGKWNLQVHHSTLSSTEVYQVNFVILCVGRFSDVPNIPQFPADKGPELFPGKVLHSMDYSAMDYATAAQCVRGKRVTVVGLQKSALDIAMECSTANGVEHPCTVVYRTNHWIVPDYVPWGVPLTYLYLNRFSELLVHKPGEGLLLALLATLLSPLDIFSRVERGSIKLKKCQTFGFSKEGVLIDNELEPIKTDLVVLATGFKGIEKLKDIFASPTFQTCIDGSPDTAVPLYRECIHPRIPQLAIIGLSESISNLYTSELRSQWLVELMDGAFKLPSIREMEDDSAKWDEYKKEYSGKYYRRSCIGALHIWYNDQLCKDMGRNPKRKNGFFAELFEPYGPMDYAHP